MRLITTYRAGPYLMPHDSPTAEAVMRDLAACLLTAHRVPQSLSRVAAGILQHRARARAMHKGMAGHYKVERMKRTLLREHAHLRIALLPRTSDSMLPDVAVIVVADGTVHFRPGDLFKET